MDVNDNLIVLIERCNLCDAYMVWDGRVPNEPIVMCSWFLTIMHPSKQHEIRPAK